MWPLCTYTGPWDSNSMFSILCEKQVNYWVLSLAASFNVQNWPFVKNSTFIECRYLIDSFKINILNGPYFKALSFRITLLCHNSWLIQRTTALSTVAYLCAELSPVSFLWIQHITWLKISELLLKSKIFSIMLDINLIVIKWY